MQEKKIIIEHSTVNLAFQVEKLIHEGWKIDERHPFQSIGLHYECGMVKVENNVEEVLKETNALVLSLSQGVVTDAEGNTQEIPLATISEEQAKEMGVVVTKQEEASKAPVRQAGRPKSK